MELPDVDLDLKDRDAALEAIGRHVNASQFSKSELVLHNTGVYLQRIPRDISGLAAFDYEFAEELGFYKVDLIPYSIYEDVETPEQLDQMVEFAQSDEFPWKWFLQERFYQGVEPLTQLGRHFELCQRYPPESILDVAVLNALIRPRKRYLVGRDWSEITEKVWTKLPDESGYFFKKSHAVAFALAILVHMQVLDRREHDDRFEEVDFYS